MAAGDTARLIASLELQDKFTPSAKTALGSLNTLETKVGTAGKSLGNLGTIGSKGLSNLAGNLARIGTVATAALGVGGLLSVGAAFESSIGKVRDFGEAVDKTASLTGLGIDKASALASALAYVGIDSEKTVKMLGMAEKNLGNLGGTAEKAAAFEKQFGMSLLDANGQMVDANELLLRSADLYTNKNIPAATKALALSKIYGRAWQDNIEVFELGRQKIAQIESEMAAFGLTLTPDNMRDWEKFRDVSRESSSAIAGLQLQLGLLVLPDLTTGIKTFVDYVRTHQADIKRFFSDGLKTAKDLGSFITGTVVPAIKSIADVAKTAWSLVPDAIKPLLVGGFVANKLTGGAVADLVSELGKGLIKGVLGINAAVVNINAATVNGGLPGPGGNVVDVAAKGGLMATLLRLVGTGAAVLGGLGIAAQVKGGVVNDQLKAVGVPTGWTDPELSKVSKGIGDSVQAQIAGGASLKDLQTSLDAINSGLAEFNPNKNPVADALTGLLYGGQIADLKDAKSALEDAIANASRERAYGEHGIDNVTRATEKTTAATQAVRDRLMRLNATEEQSKAKLGVIAAKNFSPSFTASFRATTVVSITEIANRFHTTVQNGNTVYYGNAPIGRSAGRA